MGLRGLSFDRLVAELGTVRAAAEALPTLRRQVALVELRAALAQAGEAVARLDGDPPDDVFLEAWRAIRSAQDALARARPLVARVERQRHLRTQRRALPS